MRIDLPNKQRIRDALLRYGSSGGAQKIVIFTPDERANKLILTNANAFLFAVILDQGMKAERVWAVPFALRERLGHLDASKIAAFGEEKLIEIFAQKPVLHRFPTNMARYIWQASVRLCNSYRGDAVNIWSGNLTTDTVTRRLLEFDGIGQKKASMATNILVRDLGVDLKNRRGIDVSYDIHIRRVFLRTGLVEEDNKNQLIEVARILNPEYPGALDLPCWLIGRQWCHARDPDCEGCPIESVCSKITSISLS